MLFVSVPNGKFLLTHIYGFIWLQMYSERRPSQRIPQPSVTVITNGKAREDENGDETGEKTPPATSPSSTPTPEEEVTVKEDDVWQEEEPVPNPPHSFPMISGRPLVETLENGIRFVTLLLRDHTGLWLVALHGNMTWIYNVLLLKISKNTAFTLFLSLSTNLEAKQRKWKACIVIVLSHI